MLNCLGEEVHVQRETDPTSAELCLGLVVGSRPLRIILILITKRIQSGKCLSGSLPSLRKN